MEKKTDNKEEASTAKPAPAPAKQVIPAKKMNAAERLSALENMILTLGQSIDQKFSLVAEDLDMLRNTTEALAKRVNATISAGEQGDLSEDGVKKILIDENVKELETRVEMLVKQGILVKSEDGIVRSKTFVVGREVSIDGDIINPRIQFAIPSAGVNKDIETLVTGKKVGELATPPAKEGEKQLASLEITEVYDIKDPNIKKNYEEKKAQAKTKKAIKKAQKIEAAKEDKTKDKKSTE